MLVLRLSVKSIIYIVYLLTISYSVSYSQVYSIDESFQITDYSRYPYFDQQNWLQHYFLTKEDHDSISSYESLLYFQGIRKYKAWKYYSLPAASKLNQAELYAIELISVQVDDTKYDFAYPLVQYKLPNKLLESISIVERQDKGFRYYPGEEICVVNIYNGDICLASEMLDSLIVPKHLIDLFVKQENGRIDIIVNNDFGDRLEMRLYKQATSSQ